MFMCACLRACGCVCWVDLMFENDAVMFGQSRAQLMLIFHSMPLLVPSCRAAGRPVGVVYVTQPAAGGPEERKQPLNMECKTNPNLLLCRTVLLHACRGRT